MRSTNKSEPTKTAPIKQEMYQNTNYKYKKKTVLIHPLNSKRWAVNKRQRNL